MKHARRFGIALSCLLGVGLVSADEIPKPEVETGGAHAHGLDPLAPPFDVHQWAAVQSAFVKFGEARVRVQLLKSIAPTGTDGTGSTLLYSVNLIVVDNGQLLYSFAPLAVPHFDPGRSEPVFYMDAVGVDAGCPLEIRDVTGDGVPEIIFRSGLVGASDHKTDIHVLQYTNGPMKFRDIRAAHFVESWWAGLRWLERAGRTVAIVAEPVAPSDDPEVSCHGCPHFHKYQVYQWNSVKGSFVLSETIPSTGKLHADEEDAFRADWPYIVGKLRKR